MSIRVLLKDHPHRTIALVTDSHALVFRHSPAGTTSARESTSSLPSQQSNSGQAVPRCMVEFTSSDSVDLSGYRSLRNALGTLGLVTLEKDVFLCVITGSSLAATVRPGETVQRIHSVEFYCLNKSEFDHGHDTEFTPYGGQGPSDEPEFSYALDNRDTPTEHPFAALKKLLSGGNFYYSVDFDLTKRLQERSTEVVSAVDIESLNEGLLWNSYMIGPLIQFRSRLTRQERQALDSSQLLTSVIRGYIRTLTLPASAAPLARIAGHLPSTLTLISRLSSRRAGTRFNSRGIDDDGNVANFVETETVLWHPSGICFSYTQVRGSVPLFWEQATGLLPGQQKITMSRSAEATQPAFDKHFEGLELAYGAVHIVNLLSDSKPGEVELSRRYHYHVDHSPLRSPAEKGSLSEHHLLRETNFDFHAETKGPVGYEGASLIRNLIHDSADGFGYYLSEDVYDAPSNDRNGSRGGKRLVVILQQEGVFRTNCLDCLDRTNLVQTIISQMAVESFLAHRGERGTSDFWMRHSTLWADNGDSLSKIYAGTGALKSSFTRHGKMSLAGAIADARKSATRLYVNNFADKGRQQTIDLLLGRLMWQTPVHLFDPINDFVVTELQRRAAEFSSSKKINIWTGSFNLNGRAEGASEDLSSWLCPPTKDSQGADFEPDIMAVAFQEIVELSPQQIMATDPARRQTWEDAVKRSINSNAKRRGSSEYVLLRSGQLVGAALMIFVKADSLQDIKNVEGGIKKTGLSGIAGNKGAVAIRLDFCNTSICFVTAHLAAGFANYEERNRDYKTISHGLRFQKNRSIDDHDSILFFGDFNYRIGLSDDKVRRFIMQGDLETLYENDQLNLQMVAGLTFPFYSEARILFAPTYKFDPGTDEYDTSDKARIPAWCDRILRKGTNLKQMEYNIAPLRFSDHRPVYATFTCTISVIDELAKAKLNHEIYEKRKRDLASSGVGANVDDSDDDGGDFESIAPGLPPASSETRKWWLDNGLPARSTVTPPYTDAELNPERPSNPWAMTDQPDWRRKVPLPPVKKTPKGTPNNLGSEERRSSGGRMLPPPFDGGQAASKALSRPGETSETPPALPTRPDSQASSLSSQPSIKRKPPIPKKPELLTSNSTSETRLDRSSSASSHLIKEQRTQTSSPKPAPPPSRRAGSRLAGGRTENPVRDTGSIAPSSFPPPPRDRPETNPADSGPPLPPRRDTMQQKREVGLLDDEDDEATSMASWQPLQPR